jgi:predicted benzoate:H+ symporter BenE
MQKIYSIFRYFHFAPLFQNKTNIYFTVISILLILNYFVAILLLVMAIRIKNNKLNILWPISILKIFLPFFSFTFFSQTFLLIATIFDCKNGYTYVSNSLKCRTGIWFSIFAPLGGIALFLQAIIALITHSL